MTEGTVSWVSWMTWKDGMVNNMKEIERYNGSIGLSRSDMMWLVADSSLVFTF